MNMNKRTRNLIITLIIITCIAFANPMISSVYGLDKLKLEGTSVMMIDATTGTVIYEKNAREKRDPASVTKILTCLVVLENMDLNEQIKVMEDSSPIGRNINMQKGEVLTVEQLLYALMLPSANDAARVLAIATAGDIKSFSKMMNDRAKECGATNTHFTNPNGLNTAGQEHHRTTAEDLAKITRQAMRNEQFRKIVATTKYTIPATNKHEARHLRTSDPLLASKKSIDINGTSMPLRYVGATGVKTGTTSVAGNCFVGAAKRNGTEFIAVVLNSGNMTRFTDAIGLLDYGFANYHTCQIVKEGKSIKQLRVKRGEVNSVDIGSDGIIAMTAAKGVTRGEMLENGIQVKVNVKDEQLMAPVKKGQVVGTIKVYDKEHKLVGKTSAICLQSVKKGGPLSYIGIPDAMAPLVIAMAVTIALIAVVLVILIKSKKRIKKNS